MLRPGPARAVVCRELTKTYEEIRRGDAGRAARLGRRRGPRRDHPGGGAAPPVPPAASRGRGRGAGRLAAGAGCRRRWRRSPRPTGVTKSELYDAVLRDPGDDGVTCRPPRAAAGVGHGRPLPPDVAERLLGLDRRAGPGRPRSASPGSSQVGCDVPSSRGAIEAADRIAGRDRLRGPAPQRRRPGRRPVGCRRGAGDRAPGRHRRVRGVGRDRAGLLPHPRRRGRAPRSASPSRRTSPWRSAYDKTCRSYPRPGRPRRHPGRCWTPRACRTGS